MYNYTIIGGGPSGIFCADKLSQLGYKVCLIESLEVLGGCHRVRYVNDLNNNLIHTEHGPRIYLGAYLDFWKWIKSIHVTKDKHFLNYITSTLGDDIFKYALKFKIHELLSMMIIFIIQNIFRINFSKFYTVDHFMKDFHFSNESKQRLNRICRLIDGGNTDKTTIKALFKGLDTGLAYSIYEPNEPMDTLIWDKFYDKLINQNVDILLDTTVLELHKGLVITDHEVIKTNAIILSIPPFAINNIKNASLLSGFNPNEFSILSKYQQYEPYVTATLEFKNKSPITRWGIADEHPWGLVDIDMGRYFKSKKGSLFIVSVTHPEKIDPKTNKKANDMNKEEFLERIVEIMKDRFKITEEPILKTLSPNVKKVNGGWIEYDRAFLYSPPGWLKPNFNISIQNRVFTTGHHLGNSYHDYNSMESAIQNASTLLSRIESKYNYKISKPWRISSIIFICAIIIVLLIYIYKHKKYLIRKIKKFKI
jgi:hypothetical protein